MPSGFAHDTEGIPQSTMVDTSTLAEYNFKALRNILVPGYCIMGALAKGQFRATYTTSYRQVFPLKAQYDTLEETFTHLIIGTISQNHQHSSYIYLARPFDAYISAARPSSLTNARQHFDPLP